MTLTHEMTRLDDLSKEEWFDAARILMPGLNREQYDAMWEEFMALKRIHQKHVATGTMQ